MSKIESTVYRCDNCKQEESDEANVLNWYTVGVLRNQVLSRVIQTSAIRHKFRKDFCSPECLAQWVTRRTQ